MVPLRQPRLEVTDMTSLLHVNEAVVVTSLEDDQDGHPPRQSVVEVDLDGDLEFGGGGGREWD